MKKRFATRRDACFLIGKRAARLNRREAASAWRILADCVEKLGERDVPKFNHLLYFIRSATISAKKLRREFS